MLNNRKEFRLDRYRAGLTVALLGYTALMLGIDTASAQRLHVNPNAYVATTASAPALEEPVMGGWRYQMLRRGCPHTYPMLENGQCATASGGPSGGIN